MSAGVNIGRSNTLHGREAIERFFASKRNLRLPQGSVLRAASLHTHTPEHPGLRFVIAVSKRTAKRAHDRNQLKRWIRAAVAQTAEFRELEALAETSQSEVIILFSPLGPPSTTVKWETVLSAVGSASRIQLSKLRSFVEQTHA